jgi:hypothetical protein
MKKILIAMMAFGSSGYFPALPALTTDYKAVRQNFSLAFLHWFRRFPANAEPAVSQCRF